MIERRKGSAAIGIFCNLTDVGIGIFKGKVSLSTESDLDISSYPS